MGCTFYILVDTPGFHVYLAPNSPDDLDVNLENLKFYDPTTQSDRMFLTVVISPVPRAN